MAQIDAEKIKKQNDKAKGKNRICVYQCNLWLN